MKNIKVAALVVTATLSFASLSACSTADPAGTTSNTTTHPAGYTIADGFLTACSEIPFAPFEYEDPAAEDGVTGFDIELGREIAKRLGLTYKFVAVDFAALQSGTTLAAGQCDIGISAMTITEDRRKNLDFTESYYDSLQALLVKTDSGIKTLADTANKTIGVQRGSSGQEYTEEHAPDSATILEFEGDGDLWIALQAGQIDGILQDQPVNLTHVKADADYVLAEEYDTNEQYGMAFAKGKLLELQADVAAALKAIRADGTYQTLYDKYFA
ncbi:MAG: transporter substrate-binding domain-containing protein [Propionibacteriaceae bacterium]|jgi:polar amino acid transport system substrate-binding protein|nr:transporter substrate-binding domain-containing protein [Propionibacteriaceae bacterium]